MGDALCEPCGVHQDIQATVLCLQPMACGGVGCGVVQRDLQRGVAARIAKAGAKGLCTVTAVVVPDDDAGALSRQCTHRGGTYAVAAPRDEGDFVLQ